MDIRKFQDALAKAQSVLIAISANPGFDGVAAATALNLSLANYGKKVSLFCPSPMVVEFNRLVGIDQVKTELGDKNLTITLADYPAHNIEKVSYNIEGGLMQLTIIPKPQVVAPQPHQIVPSYGGVSSDTVIFLGVESEEKIGDKMFGELSKIPQQITIAQHVLPAARQFAGVLELYDPYSSSLAELVGMLLFESNLPIDEDCAGNLLMGLSSATGNFTASKVRAETFELAAKLMRVRGAGTETVQPTPQDVKEEPPPEDWLTPKVYKGTTLP